MLKLPWTWYWVKRSCKSKEIDTDEIDFFCRFSDVAFLGSTMLLPPYHDLCRSYFSHLLREDSGRKQAHTHRIWGAWFVTVDSSTTVYIHRFENWWEPEFSGNWSKNLPPDYTWAPTSTTDVRNMHVRNSFAAWWLASRDCMSKKWVTLGLRSRSSSREDVRTWKSSCASWEEMNQQKQMRINVLFTAPYI